MSIRAADKHSKNAVYLRWLKIIRCMQRFLDSKSSNTRPIMGKIAIINLKLLVIWEILELSRKPSNEIFLAF